MPIPRNDRTASWQSVVHLHGRLEPRPHSNDQLVVTSADFGRAYLTDGWAARFIARLFADFVLLFVGYSVNDPVLRYMTDAFAAEALTSRRLLQRPSAYIFVPFRGKRSPAPGPWRDRGLEPIFYHAARSHKALRDTVVGWAAARDDWLSSTARTIASIAPSIPETLTPSELSNLLWALFERPADEGYGARVFAALDPSPPIEWLSAIERYEERLLDNYAKLVERAHQANEAVPAPRRLPLRLLTVVARDDEIRLSSSALHLGQWLTRHLGKHTLIDWVAKHARHGRHSHARIRDLIRARLAAPDIGLTPPVRLFWRIVSAEGVWTNVAQNSRAYLGASQTLPGTRLIARLPDLSSYRSSDHTCDWAQQCGETLGQSGWA